ncbi:MAG TPA: esterase-like activity of phytase family protein [Thermoanaerobaculaceae bacterium]|nr:esterase-like activity of phytase family protein [Thermoanaerobaculaceae bacterium]
MRRFLSTVCEAVMAAGALAGGTALFAAPSDRQQAFLLARSVLPAATYRVGSPPAGAFLSAAERTAAAATGVRGPASGPYFAAQPVQGFSSMVPGEAGTWWALADNGFAWRSNSADFQLVFYRFDPRWGDPGGPRVLETVVLHDPDRRIQWTIVCDQASGTPLPDFSFNVLPAAPSACGGEPAARILTGFDLDPESFVRAPDGTFWVSEEFGPFLVHVAADGRVLEPPVPFPGVRSPQNPFLKIADRAHAERPTLASSRGPEGLAISPDGAKLYALLEGAVAGDDPQDLRIYVYDVAKRAFAENFLKLRLEMPSQTVNLAGLNDASGVRVYPDAVAPPAGPVSIGELKAVNDRQLLVIERDNHGDDLPAPRFKKVFLLDLAHAAEHDGYVGKTLLLDLLAIPDPTGVGGDGDFFRLPCYTIESIHVVDERTLLIASDNNYPFSNGRARSRSSDRRGPLTADDTELLLVRLGSPLAVDRRLLPATGR